MGQAISVMVGESEKEKVLACRAKMVVYLMMVDGNDKQRPSFATSASA